MLQTCTKEVQNRAGKGEESNLLGVLQDIKIWTNYKMVYAQTGIRP